MTGSKRRGHHRIAILAPHRHGTATHALTAGIDVKLVQDLLGHTTSSLAHDTYQGVAD